MRPRLTFALLLAAALGPITLQAHAQWQLQDPHVTADLRGIDSLGKGVAWASGTNGTVLRTEDAGFVWQLCAIPPGAEHLDFRGIHAFDNNTAIVMSSGKGDLSRLYKTTDGCQTWTLVAANHDKDGFWDTLIFQDAKSGWLLGDPVHDEFVLDQVRNSTSSFEMENIPQPPGWRSRPDLKAMAANGRGAFAASNSTLAVPSHLWRPPNPTDKPQHRNCQYADLWFGTSGPGGAQVIRRTLTSDQCYDSFVQAWAATRVPLTGDSASSGVFSIAHEDGPRLVAVGGDYTRPLERKGTAAYTEDGGATWIASETTPGGYRSAVAYTFDHNAWITVGPNGTDVSTDDGRNWHPLKPGPEDQPDADQHWNALSLPFVVGPHGRIGVLRPEAFAPSKPKAVTR